MRILILTGEVSGDQYGAQLVLALKSLNPHIDIWALGGHRMAQAGAHLIADLTPYASIGFIEPIKHVGVFMRAYWTVKRWITTHRPDHIVAIDNQGFNMALLKGASRLGISTSYFVSPQEWQWGTEKGAHHVLSLTDRLYAIFEQEASYYSRLGGDVMFVGHPLLDTTICTQTREMFCAQYGLDPGARIVSVFPGSREQELSLTAPVLIQSAIALQRKDPSIQCAISVSSPIFLDRIRQLATGLTCVFVSGNAINLIAHTHLSLVVSGTVTLEHALLKTPCLIGYRFNPLSFWVAQRLLKERLARIPFMGLPNLLANREIFPEFFQQKCCVENIYQKAWGYLCDEEAYQIFKKDVASFAVQLGEPGVFNRVAFDILSTLRKASS